MLLGLLVRVSLQRFRRTNNLALLSTRWEIVSNFANFFTFHADFARIPNQTLYKVEAVDADENLNGLVSYTLLKTEPTDAAGLFQIDEKTGYITTSAAIDREKFEK